MHDTRRTRLVLAVLLIAALALITVSARNSSAGPVRGLRALGGLIFGSAESVASGVTQPVTGFLDNIGNAAHSQATIGALRREVVQLRGELSQARLSKTEAAQLQQLLQLAGDVMDRGIALTGGGALLRGLDERLREETGMPIHLADNPLDSVVLGTGKCVEDFDTLRQVLVPESRR